MVSELKKRFFSESDCKAIEDCIHGIEKKTRGELVVALIPASDSYFRNRLFGGIVALSLSSMGLLVYEFQGHWGLSFHLALLIQVGAFILGVGLSYFPFLSRPLVPRGILARNVHREALAQFLALGLHETKEHTGVLILLSVYERTVEIVADRGIHQKVDASYWKKHTDHISKGFSTHQAAKNLIDALQDIGTKLAEHFPPDPSNPNELSNAVRFIG